MVTCRPWGGNRNLHLIAAVPSPAFWAYGQEAENEIAIFHI